MEERLQKIMASLGVGSRRHCEELIKSGRVTVDGKIAELGMKADGEASVICVDGQAISAGTSGRKIYIMLNKPKGYVSTVKDEGGRATVMELVADIPERVFPIGRLDKDTRGLLLFTNDGDLAYVLMHPKHLVEKVYIAKVKFPPNQAALEALRRGVMLEDGLTSPALADLLPDGTVRLVIREGRKRQVRRMLSAVGCPVTDLARVQVGPLKIGNLALGKYRFLTSGEIRSLKSIGLPPD